MDKTNRIFVAGHRGLVGSAILRKLQSEGYSNLITRTRQELDLTRQDAVERFFAAEKPQYVFLAAAKVGGIYANNTYAADFIRDNLQIQTNVIDAAYRNGAKKLQLLGSACIYPKFSPQPIKEEHLLTGKVEPTNEAYALAKIAGIIMCQKYWQQYGFKAISLMPTNLYGPGDNFDLQNSHVLPALIHRFHEAAQTAAPAVVVWGTGAPRRELMHVNDLADACLFAMQHYESPDVLNIGLGEDISIGELAHLVAEIVGYQGRIEFDTSKPDGMPRRLLDVGHAHDLGWKAKISLPDGIRETYAWYLDNVASHKVRGIA